ncbi:hypothetical protein GCM10029964_124130 [Kibdelosporangium lantanae]
MGEERGPPDVRQDRTRGGRAGSGAGSTVVGMLNVLGILVVFLGLSIAAAIPLVVMLHWSPRQEAVNEVTPRDQL